MKRVYFPIGASLYLLVVTSFVIAQSPTTSPPIIIQMQPQPRDFMDYLIAIIQLLTLIGLIIYVVKTWQIAAATKNAAQATNRSAALSEKVIEEMKAARMQESAPQVIIYIDMPDSSNWALYLVAKNIGKSVAKNVQFNLDPPLMCGFGNESRESDIWFVDKGYSLASSWTRDSRIFRCHAKLLR